MPHSIDMLLTYLEEHSINLLAYVYGFNYGTTYHLNTQTYRSKRITQKTFCLRSLVPRDK